jgi:plastocyanin
MLGSMSGQARSATRRSIARAESIATACCVALAWLAVVGAGLGLTAGSARAASVEISIRDFWFEPGSVVAAPGDTVTFRNDGSAVHTVVADDGSFSSGDLGPGDSFSFTVGDAPVTYSSSRYQSMTGTIAVEAVGTSATTATTEPAVVTAAAVTSTTSSALAHTGPADPALVAVACAVLLLGGGVLLAARRRRPLIGATVVGDSIIPASFERDRRDRVRRPPAEL